MAQRHEVHTAHRGYQETVAAFLAERRATHSAALGSMVALSSSLAAAGEALVDTLRAGGKVLAAGNGGSAAEAQHFVAELVGRFEHDRAPYAALALTTDPSVVTAVANDYGYDHIFARQVFALGTTGDVFLAYSTSGESENLVRAAVAARQRGMTVMTVTGSGVSRLSRLADHSLRVPVEGTAAIQELHMMVTHLLCTLVEEELRGEEA